MVFEDYKFRAIKFTSIQLLYLLYFFFFLFQYFPNIYLAVLLYIYL